MAWAGAAAPDRRRARRQRWLVLGVPGFLVALELGMQAVAFVTWRGNDGYRVGATTAERRVLCIGDSVTFGLGVGGEWSYPRQLERELRRTMPDVDVANAGKPGQDSADALRRLTAQLATLQPQLVYALFGFNDRLNHPRPVADDELEAPASAGFDWRFRAIDLLAWIAHTIDVDLSDVPSAAGLLTGVWHGGTLEIELRADRLLRIRDRTSRWSASRT